MADTVSTKVLHNGSRKYVAEFTNISDGTGESTVTKVDISTLATPAGGPAPSSVTIEEIEWAVNGFEGVSILFDHTTDDQGPILSGSGYKDYRQHGGWKDPGSAGGTGDILVTTLSSGAGASNDNYSIKLVLRLEP